MKKIIIFATALINSVSAMNEEIEIGQVNGKIIKMSIREIQEIGEHAVEMNSLSLSLGKLTLSQNTKERTNQFIQEEEKQNKIEELYNKVSPVVDKLVNKNFPISQTYNMFEEGDKRLKVSGEIVKLVANFYKEQK